MEVDNENTTGFNSYLVNNVMRTDMTEPSKKRKFQDENILMPFPKHTCISHIESEGSNTLADSSLSISSSSSTNIDSIDSPMLIIKDQKHPDAVELVCPDYEIAEIAEIEEILYCDSDEKNPNSYVLSSGRWSVGQDCEQDGRKPTIDQEFEEYFSMLML